MANALGRKLGDLESRLILSFPNQDNSSNRRVKEIEDEQWRGTKTVEDIEQCINRLEWANHKVKYISLRPFSSLI